jgi:single-strand DNA-binding protein
MLNLNRAQILGNLTRDPEMRYTPNGQAVSSFTVATNRKWKGRDGAPDGEDTQYHDIVVWGKQAEAVTPMLKKGAPAFVEGRLQTRNWEGQDGVKRYKTEIIADNIIVLGSRNSGGSSYAPRTEENNNSIEDIADDKKEAAPAKNEVKTDEIDIEEIPF